MLDDVISISEFSSFNIAIIVYFLGVRLNRFIPVLNHYNIPEPVTGGLAVSGTALLVYLLVGAQISFSMGARDFLLLYFFTAIGLNARFADLLTGGKPLLLLLVLTVGFMFLQNGLGTAMAVAMGLPAGFGLIGGTVALIGGHGTAIAWGPQLAEHHGVIGAVELGAATATLGLIAASLLGGPIADFLINKRGAKPKSVFPEDGPVVGLEREDEPTATVTHTGLMASLLVLNLAIALGVTLEEILRRGLGIELPMFVVCLFSGILLSNTVPFLFKGIRWPARSRSLAVISDLALGIFLAMSLMSLQLWTIAGLAGPMLIILAAQLAGAALFVVFVLFPVMGRDYEAAVLGAGFAGFALGATPTAIANMTAVTKQYGSAAQAFLILPLVSAFFVDLANAAIIWLFLSF